MMKESFTLKKDEILSKRDDITLLFKKGKSFNIYPFKILHNSPNAENKAVKVGFSIPKRLFKKAVDRNLLKRRCKEAYRKNKIELKQQVFELNFELHFMFIYIAKEPMDYNQIEQKIILTLQRLQALYAEDTE